MSLSGNVIVRADQRYSLVGLNVSTLYRSEMPEFSDVSYSSCLYFMASAKAKKNAF